MALIRARHWKRMAQAAVFALAAGTVPLSAQDANAPGPDSDMPQDIAPDADVPPDAPDDAMPATEAGDNSPIALPSAGMAGRGGSVVVGDLGTLEGPVAGTLDDAHGALGYDAWQSSDRATMETLLLSNPVATPSGAARMLLRKMLLTIAPPPPGTADRSFNALRVMRLLDAGFVNDAADLALTMQAPMNAEILRAQADALVYSGRDSDICGDATAMRLESAEPYWVELRAYCYAVMGESTALELTRSVIDEQGLSDPSFLTLLAGMTSGKPVAPEVIRLPDSVHTLMLSRLKLPIPRDIALDNGLPATLIAAASAETPKALRVDAAEKAMRAGALPPDVLGQVLDLSTFTPQELIGAPALARTEGIMAALARLRAALKVASAPVARADFIHAAFEIGEREGLLAQVAELFADDAAALEPARDWGNWSDIMVRGLLLAGKPEAAARWYDILDPRAPATADLAGRLYLSLALADNGMADPLMSSSVLLRMAERANPPPPVPRETGAGAFTLPLPPPPRPAQAALARIALDLGLYEALGKAMPAEARDAVESLVSQQWPGRRPPPALMQRIDRAALAGARGEVALTVWAVLGARGAGDLAPDVAVRLVRALRTAGIGDAAEALALEALLMRPAGG